MTSALAGRRIVVTRAAEQANDLAELLQEVGAVPVVIPLIEIVTDVTEVARLADLADRTGGAFANFDWLIVTSPNGAQHVVDVVNAVNRPLECRVGAIGATTAQVLRAGGLEVALVPAVQSAVGLLAEMAPAGSVLLVQGANAEATLADGLRERGSAVTVVAPYSTSPRRVSAGQQLAALAADAVLFVSGSAARAWVDVFGDSTPPVVVAIGPRTAAVVTDAGLKVSIVAADHSLTGMVAALERHLSSQR
ncbi:hypothetical protein BH10ACT2_BH10ACT2_13320 [soil metagenome]